VERQAHKTQLAALSQGQTQTRRTPGDQVVVALAFVADIIAFIMLWAVGGYPFAVGWGIFVAGMCLLEIAKKKVLT